MGGPRNADKRKNGPCNRHKWGIRELIGRESSKFIYRYTCTKCRKTEIRGHNKCI